MANNIDTKTTKTRSFMVPEAYRYFPAEELPNLLEQLIFYETDMDKNYKEKVGKLIYKRFKLTPYDEMIIQKAKKLLDVPYDKDIVSMALLTFDITRYTDYNSKPKR